MKVLVTGAAGFIGMHITKYLLSRGDTVVGIDNLWGDGEILTLKTARLAELGIPDAAEMLDEKWRDDNLSALPSRFRSTFRFYLCDIADRMALPEIFRRERFEAVVNLAARAGVRASAEDPQAYVDSNISGLVNLLECCRDFKVTNVVYASSSSVYGDAGDRPLREADAATCDPVSIYAATKRADEMLARCYSQMYGIRATGLRFFTVYGPWGRPDMAPMLFARAIYNDRPIKVFNHGDLKRDFTFVDDIVEGTVRLLDTPAEAGKCDGGIPHRVFNIGCCNPVMLGEFISLLEKNLGKEAQKEMLPMQPGDVHHTWADTSALQALTGFKPGVLLPEGIRRFAEWFLSEKNPLK